MNKNFSETVKGGLIKTGTTTGTFFALNVANVKPPKTALEAMDNMKFAGRICGWMLVKD